MANKESFRDRQIAELEVIKSIFGPDVEDLRSNENGWKPLDIRILLTPLHGSSGTGDIYVRTKLHISCPPKYPKVLPKISLEESKGISDTLLEGLLQNLNEQAASLKGEVMIYDLTQTVQSFLHAHNKPPPGSLYDQMLEERKKRQEELLMEKMQKENEHRQALQEEIQRRKELFQKENRRREPRRSMSESNRQASSSESSENSSPYFRGHVVSKCLDHRSTETLYFPKIGRQIRRGCCVGHSQKGCIAYSGIDLDTGQLLFITEWLIKYSQIESKCSNGSCYWLGESNCNGHKVDDFISAIEKHVSNLSQLNHKNLIQYECVLCLKRKEGVVVYLVQDFVLGTSVFSISSSLGWCPEGTRMVAKGVLDALIYLHNKGVSYNQLLDTNVFMDNSGTIRCTDFGLVPNLFELVSGQKYSQGDLPALGYLIETLLPTLPFDLRDFVDKCNSDRTISASELVDHPFLRSPIYHDELRKDALRALQTQRCDVDPTNYSEGRKERRESVPVTNGNVYTIPTLSLNQSRLRTEFEVQSYLGKGAFGDVLKVRNMLDNRQYAIKRIPLPARSRQLYKKMTREVELLSRLNHENVVRYFNSWIESSSAEDLEEMDKGLNGDYSTSKESVKLSVADSEDSSSSLWERFNPNMDDSDSDGIEFVDSNGEAVVYESEETETDNQQSSCSRPICQVMYIQMEFCEKCTLRSAIDDNLYEKTEKLWRYFREIAEGLSHIHQQGIIHRDLKPVNIFLDSRDQIKIGDFGLATTSFLALQCQGNQVEHSTSSNTHTEEGTGTGKVGTTLYVAPELTGNASKSTYNQKVDMYTLGIILFEMNFPPFDTGMERVQTILNLRSSNVTIPESMLKDEKHKNTVQIIKWLLNHDISKRPTAEELLASDLVPPAQLEANELQEMLRHALANPQSKSYKHLVARCLQQESDSALEMTYHMGLISLNPIFEYVKCKVINLFRRHGAIEVDTPLLTPLSKNTYNLSNPVKLMTHSGGVVVLPSDLRAPFARHIAMSGKNMIRRYSVDRVYREKKVFNFHPKQTFECAFDIISPSPGNFLIDAELISVAFAITNEIPRLKEKNIHIRMNHTTLLKSILLYCNVPRSKYVELFENVMDFIEGKLSKFHLHSAVCSILETSKTSATVLIDLLLVDFILGGPRGSADGSALKTLIRGKSEASSLAKGALRELEAVVNLAQSLGVTCAIHLCPGLPISFDHASSGGVVWQMMANLKPDRSARPSVIAVGERYDTMLHEYQKQAQNCNVNIPNRGISGAGLSFSLDKLVAAIGSEFEQECRGIDVAICVTGTRPPLKDVTHVLKGLWSADIRSGVVEAINADEAQDLAKDLGAVHVILLAEDGSLRVRSWDRERFQEKHVTRTELVQYIQKLLKSDSNVQTDYTSTQYALTTSLSSISIKNTSTSSNSFINLPNVKVVFLMHEKLTANMRRRYENQVTQSMSSTLIQFAKKESFWVLVVDLPPSELNALVGAINPREVTKKETESEINVVIERFPKHKRYISEIYDEIADVLMDKSNTIIALYSFPESCYRVII